ncbi:hypothetical protein EYF80_030499 [Liparis tanakae]|uniref:Ig-like domain-containing protein n=1 Tax=Liparis tanakae TaxID=230148 RepID=A0A4Z2H151_9TELE|nr:hypothetical protein EYF80_030499 [Liparis tanakae]
MTLVLVCIDMTEGNTVSELVGSKVTLHCENESNDTLIQLTWKMNEVTLFSFMPDVPLHVWEEARRLNIHVAGSRPDTLVIERAQKSHTGNYTCEINTNLGFKEHKWELRITERKKRTMTFAVVVATVVPCACYLVFMLASVVLHIVRKQRADKRKKKKKKMCMKTVWKLMLVNNGATISRRHYKHTDQEQHTAKREGSTGKVCGFTLVEAIQPIEDRMDPREDSDVT